MTLRKDLSDSDVRALVDESIGIIAQAQTDLGLLIAPFIDQTKKRLELGSFKAIRFGKQRSKKYAMDFGSFIPPATIILDKRLPSSDHPLDMPDYAETMTTYTAVHEVIHADDHTGGDKLLLGTRRHILEKHQDKLEKSMRIIMQEGGSSAIKNYGDLASLWAVQYVDMVTHYRSYVILRYLKYPKLDELWSQLRNDYFPPNLLTCIELTRGTDYLFSLFTKQLGEYCLIEALEEYNEIKNRDSCSYTV